MMTGYAPANLLKVLLEDHVTGKLRGFQKFVHFPLSEGLILAGGGGLPVGKLAMVSFDGENNTMTAYLAEVIKATDGESVKHLLAYHWEEFKP